MVVGLWHHLDDVAESVFCAGVGRIDLVGLSSRVVGQHDVDFMRFCVDLRALRPIHLRRAHEVTCATRFNDNVRLRAETVAIGQRTLAINQRQPFTSAVCIVLGYVKRALVQEVQIG